MRPFIALCFVLFSIHLYAQPKNWSDPATWGGTKPVAGQAVTIPAGEHIILNENPPQLAGLTINGTLEFASLDIELRADWILVNGTLQVGTAANPYSYQAVIELGGADVNENIMGMGTRGILVVGTLELHGVTPQIPFTRINANATAGATQLTLAQTVNWSTGDQILIAPTDFYQAAGGNSVTQFTSISGLSGTTLNLGDPLNAYRYGSLQYVTANGLSTSQGTLPNLDSAQALTPLILDERALVANVSRNIHIQAPDDALWQNQGFGVHVMVMGQNSVAYVEGVQILRGGQAGILARYPFHFHQKSYSGNQFAADASGEYFRNSAILHSAQRGIVIHGTCGVEVSKNIIYDVRGHGIFTEDAVERRNVIDSNVVLLVRNPLAGDELKNHETGNFGSSGFWISNPDNTLTHNWAGDCEGFGFWLAFPSRPFGMNNGVLHTDGFLLQPNRLAFGVFDANTAHSNRLDGIRLDDPEIDEDGNTFPLQYSSTSNGREPEWNSTTRQRFELENYQVWKNGRGGIWDRAVWPTNTGAISADNCGRFFAGSGADGLIQNCLVIGTSLNHLLNGTDRSPFNETLGGNETPVAFATYHSTFDIRNNIVVNFPLVDSTRSGVFATEDYYTRPVDKGQYRNLNNVQLNSFTGVKLEAQYPWFKLTGALWDPHGNWTGQPGNSYFVYDDPFFTFGQSPVSVGANAGGVFVQGPFYGINDFVINRANLYYEDLMALDVRRFQNGTEVGLWEIEEAGATDWLLAHMRHFAAHPSGEYWLSFPGIDTVRDIAFSVENMLSTDDSLVIGIEYSGKWAITQVYSSSFANFMDSAHAAWPESFALKHVYRQVPSKDSLRTETYWHDSTANMVWVHVQGGIAMSWNPNDYPETSDEKLYRLFNLRVYGTRKPDVPEDSSGNTGLKQPETKQFRAYPNPASDHITLDVKEFSVTGLHAVVVDIQGRILVYEEMDKEPERINLHGFPAGIYQVLLMDGESILARTRFVLIK